SVIDSWNRSFSEKHEYVIKNVKDSYSAGDLFFDRFNVRQVMAVSFFHNGHLAGAIFIFDAKKNPTDVTVAKSVSFFIYCEILRKKFIENSEKTKGAVIEALAAEYASVFYIDVDSGAITAYRYNNVLKDTYYGQFGKVPPYSEAYQFYVDTFVIPSDADEMGRFGSIQNLKNVLKNRSSVSKKYQAKTKSGVKYFEAKWVKIGDAEEDPKTVVLGFTDIDDRVHQQIQAEIERNIQKLRLDSALEQAEEATKESQFDKLTEIYNKISGMEIMNSYISLKPENESYAIIFIDLDKFKNINDTYGHLEGDVILKGVGQIINKNSRVEDIAVRFGGDEFIILLKNVCDEEIVKRKTDALAMEIAHLSYGKEYIVSCSIGAYITSSRDLEKSLDCADKLLYKIKKHGRDGVKIEKDKN
uniref:GGDEF domain-containing protein n=1 Tax=Treponema sp. TaxID=166 RepID=UPI00298E1D64